MTVAGGRFQLVELYFLVFQRISLLAQLVELAFFFSGYLFNLGKNVLRLLHLCFIVRLKGQLIADVPQRVFRLCFLKFLLPGKLSGFVLELVVVGKPQYTGQYLLAFGRALGGEFIGMALA
ncbi:hypothetical protein ES703_44863 [subsurface metagenome]